MHIRATTIYMKQVVHIQGTTQLVHIIGIIFFTMFDQGVVYKVGLQKLKINPFGRLPRLLFLSLNFMPRSLPFPSLFIFPIVGCPMPLPMSGDMPPLSPQGCSSTTIILVTAPTWREAAQMPLGGKPPRSRRLYSGGSRPRPRPNSAQPRHHRSKVYGYLSLLWTGLTIFQLAGGDNFNFYRLLLNNTHIFFGFNGSIFSVLW